MEDAHNAVHQYDLGKILGADQKAGDAANFAKIAHDEADAATGASKTAQRKADAVGNKADELNLQLLTANAKLDAVEAKRAELEKSLWPREFPLTRNIPKGHDNFAPLKPFAGTNVVIDFLPDAEAARAASQIVGLVHAAGWNIIEVKPNPEVIAGFFDGVIVHAPLGVPRKTLEDTKEGENLEGAASAVVSFLTSYNWVARTHPAKLHEFGVNTIKISIGFKPSPYFRDPEIKKTMEEIERRNR